MAHTPQTNVDRHIVTRLQPMRIEAFDSDKHGTDDIDKATQQHETMTCSSKMQMSQDDNKNSTVKSSLSSFIITNINEQIIVA